MTHTIGCTTRPYSSLTFSEACEHIAAAGYTDVAIFANDGRISVQADSTNTEISEVRKVVANAGLVPSMLLGSTQLNLGLDAALDHYRRLLDKIALLGGKWLLDCGTGDPARYPDYLKLMRLASPYAAQAGINITMKPHGGISLTVDDLCKADHEVNHTSFGICFDPGNIIYYTKGKLRPESDLAAVASKVTTAIVKDCVFTNGTPDVMVTPGEGLVDFKRVLDGLVAGGFDGPLYVECVGGHQLDEIDRNVKSTLRFVSNILARGSQPAALINT